MTPEGRFIFGWFVMIILFSTFMVGVVGLYNYNSKKERRICGLMSFTSMMAVILLSNLL